MLSDTDYMGHELYRMTDARAIVIVTTGNGCPIARNLAPQLKTVKTYVLMSDENGHKPGTVDALSYESVLSKQPTEIAWPKIDENAR